MEGYWVLPQYQAHQRAQAELANQTGETDSEEEGDDEGDEDEDGI